MNIKKKFEKKYLESTKIRFKLTTKHPRTNQAGAHFSLKNAYKSKKAR